MTDILVVNNLKKAYQSNVVLNDINVVVKDQEIVSLMGTSGIGKSTLLRCINKLETIDSGEISIKGIAITDKNYQEQIGLVFQNYNLFPHLSVLENLIQPLLIKKIDKETAIKKADELLAKLNILDKKLAYPNQLSGGQKQRVAICRACMLNPKLLCFDEPTSALDAASIEDVKKTIKELSNDMAILIVTHDENFARAVSTRIIKMQDANTLN